MRSLYLAVLLLWCGVASAAIDAYPFPDEETRARYDRLIAELRCPQCLNTNLAGSDAIIAAQLRREVHRMLLEGATDAEIRAFLTERYGDFVLYRPRLTAGTVLLWFGPALFLLMAALVLARLIRSRRASRTALTADEARKLDELLTKR